MPDTIDALQEDAALQSEELLRKAHEAVERIPAGTPGICQYCDESSPRLVNDACARCRDEMHSQNERR